MAQDPPPRLGGTRNITISDPIHGDFRVLQVIPKREDPWGCLAPLQGTYWEQFISVVSGEVWSHALHGLTQPLREKLGRPPKTNAKLIPDKFAWCQKIADGTCGMAGKNCRPGTKALPICYMAPHKEFHISDLAAGVALALDENRYVIVVEGEGFVL